MVHWICPNVGEPIPIAYTLPTTIKFEYIFDRHSLRIGPIYLKFCVLDHLTKNYYALIFVSFVWNAHS